MMSTLAGMSLSGSAVLVLWLAASRLLRTRLPARWHYLVLKTSLLFFLIPVGRLLPLMARALSAMRPVPAITPVPVPAPVSPGVPAAALPRIPVTLPAAPLPSPALPLPEPVSVTAEVLRVLAAVWALGAAVMLAYKLCIYLRLRSHLLRQNRPVSSREAQLVFWGCKRQMGIRGPVELRENPGARSPFAAGLLRPTVVIPSRALEREELRYLFSHELTHIQCGDLWVRLLAMLVQVLHWFNPLAHLLSRSIRTVSEQSCDERVAAPLSREERYAYGNMILKLAAGTASWSGDWAASLSARESIERRLIRVLRTEKLKGGKRLAALALSLAILACGGGAALAARNPLAVSKEAKEPAHTVAAPPKEEGGKSGGNTAKPGESTVKPAEAPPADTPPKTDVQPEVPEAEPPEKPETEKPEEPKTAKRVTTNGTPSEAFLKELRAYYADSVPGITEDTPVLFGDHELILKRGGTLLPDEEFSSYTCCWGGSENLPPVIYKQFHTKPHADRDNSVGYTSSEEYYVGNKEALAGFKLKNLSQLVNGEYPKNSRGESYGSESFGRYVGYHPDLVSARGTRGESGYIYRPDESSVPCNLPKDQCPHAFLIPLYDEEHNEIGKFEMCCGGHFMEEVIARNMTVEEAKAALASGELSYAAHTYGDPSANVLETIRAAFADQGATSETPVLFGNPELIAKRGGTLMADSDLEAYRMVDGSIHKMFWDKNQRLRDEYLVGNRDLVDFPNQLEHLTADGDYPKNSRGETYGAASLAGYVGYTPDLAYQAGNPNEGRPAGYIYSRDDAGSPLNRYDPNAAEKPRSRTDSAAYRAWRAENPDAGCIPLYDAQGEIIGTYHCAPEASPDTSGMRIEEAKAALDNQPAN